MFVTLSLVLTEISDISITCDNLQTIFQNGNCCNKSFSSAGKALQDSGLWDYIIIGSGPGGAGALLAAADTNSSALLLERGSDMSEEVFLGRHDYYKYVPWTLDNMDKIANLDPVITYGDKYESTLLIEGNRLGGNSANNWGLWQHQDKPWMQTHPPFGTFLHSEAWDDAVLQTSSRLTQYRVHPSWSEATSLIGYGPLNSAELDQKRAHYDATLVDSGLSFPSFVRPPIDSMFLDNSTRVGFTTMSAFPNQSYFGSNVKTVHGLMPPIMKVMRELKIKPNEPYSPSKPWAVKTDHDVDEIVVVDGRAVGVRVGERILSARKGVILAAGTMGTLTLMTKSGLGPSRFYENESSERQQLNSETKTRLDNIGKHFCHTPDTLLTTIALKQTEKVSQHSMFSLFGDLSKANVQLMYYPNGNNMKMEDSLNLGLGVVGFFCAVGYLPSTICTFNNEYTFDKFVQGRTTAKAFQVGMGLPDIDPFEFSMKGVDAVSQVRFENGYDGCGNVTIKERLLNFRNVKSSDFTWDFGWKTHANNSFSPSALKRVEESTEQAYHYFHNELLPSFYDLGLTFRNETEFFANMEQHGTFHLSYLSMPDLDPQTGYPNYASFYAPVTGRNDTAYVLFYPGPSLQDWIDNIKYSGGWHYTATMREVANEVGEIIPGLSVSDASVLPTAHGNSMASTAAVGYYTLKMLT